MSVLYPIFFLVFGLINTVLTDFVLFANISNSSRCCIICFLYGCVTFIPINSSLNILSNSCMFFNSYKLYEKLSIFSFLNLFSKYFFEKECVKGVPTKPSL